MFSGLTDKLNAAFRRFRGRGKLTEAEYAELISMLKGE